MKDVPVEEALDVAALRENRFHVEVGFLFPPGPVCSSGALSLSLSLFLSFSLSLSLSLSLPPLPLSLPPLSLLKSVFAVLLFCSRLSGVKGARLSNRSPDSVCLFILTNSLPGSIWR